MALPYPIASTQTDAKSPIDQQLMDAIRLNQEHLDTEISNIASGSPLTFKLNGPLYVYRALLNIGGGRKVDGAIITQSIQYSRARLYCKKGGTSGTTEVDVFRNLEINRPITSILSQYEGATQSIGRLGVALNTQSISIATPTINTQQITLPKVAQDIRSIVPVKTQNGDRWLITFTGGTLLDSDYQQGDYITIASTTNANNEGIFQIEQVNYDGLPSVVIDNPLGVLQTGTAGTGQLNIFEYTYLASVDSQFVAGEEVILAGHTNPNNNGTFTIYKTNEAGNNIWIKNQNGVDQGGVAGTASCTRWVYSLSAPADDTHYIVGEKAEMSGHTSGSNNGKFFIRAVNNGGNNIYVSNTAGVSQGGAGGTINTLRWLYSMPTDPSTDITVGDIVKASGHTNSNNDGNFDIKTVNRFAVNNLEIYNENGVAQAGIAGLLESALKIVSFDADYSSDFVVDKSKVLLEGVSSSADETRLDFDVKEINRGVAQFNIVIDAIGLTKQEAPAGRVVTEARSIFSTRPSITVSQENQIRNFQVDDSAVFEVQTIPAESILTMDIISIQEGLPEGLTLNLS